MADQTKIEWAHHTWNPWVGCTKVSPGCKFCYAAAHDRRFGGDHWGAGKPRHRTTKGNWRQPYKWRKRILANGSPRERVFPSLMDPFDDEVPIQWFRDMCRVIAETSDALDWLLVTKRPELIKKRLVDAGMPADFFLAHKVWLLVSIESEDYIHRIADFWYIPAAIHGVSAEPLLGEVDFDFDSEVGPLSFLQSYTHFSEDPTPKIDWVIVGGESASQKDARSADIAWVRKIVQQCKAAGVPVFVKQLGTNPVDGQWVDAPVPFPILTNHLKGGDPTEWPEDLRVREIPEVAA